MRLSSDVDGTLDLHHRRSAALAPRVSMGMPVYNGEPFIEEALRSLLRQSYDDFEVVISDNASTDRTSNICLDYASTDRRIRYLRNAVNVGFCRNQNRVIELCVGKYFLLTHHDDIRHPDYLARSVAIMDADESIVVCYTKTQDIDENGNPLPRIDPPLRLDSENMLERFRDVIRMDHKCEPDFGLTRMDKLRTTTLHGDYADSDRVLLAELLLHGRFYCIPECLFFRRDHAQQSTAIAPDRYSRTVWFNPAYKGKLVFPHFRQFREYVAAIRRAPINRRERAKCLSELMGWVRTNRGRLLDDLRNGFRQTLRPVYHSVFSRAK